jgi:hypothetical protein
MLNSPETCPSPATEAGIFLDCFLHRLIHRIANKIKFNLVEPAQLRHERGCRLDGAGAVSATAITNLPPGAVTHDVQTVPSPL